MILPLGIAEQRKRATVVTWYIMGITALCMLGQQVVLNQLGSSGYNDFIDTFGWSKLSMPWGLFTYQLLHGDLWHLGGNMLFLWAFGAAVEDRIGRTRFILLYVLGGIAAAIGQSLFNDPSAPVRTTIGASGSVAAVTGAFLVLSPRAPMRILFFFFLIGVFTIPAWWLIIFAVMKDLFWLGITTSTNGETGVAHAAHLGGYAFGFTAAMFMLQRGWARKDQYNLFTAQRQARRRRAFKIAVEEAERDRQRAEKAAAKKTLDPKIDALRTQASTAVRSGDMESAVDAFENLLAVDPSAVLSKDIQLSLAQHLHASGNHKLAAQAFQAILDRSPNDRDANATAIMLAVIRCRYLNDNASARDALSRVKQETLSESERSIHNDIARECEFKPKDATE